MTQKRGLGRGLGALIPGAGSAPAPEQELRTRAATRARSEEAEQSASERPVDMFFSGEELSEEERQLRDRGPRQDLAGDMARDAAKRRGRGASTHSNTGRSTTAGTASDPDDAETSKQPRAASSAKKTPAKTAATKTAATKTTGTQTTGAKTAPTKTTATKTAAAKTTGSKGTGTNTAPKGTAAKDTAAKGAAAKGAAAKDTAAKGTAAAGTQSTSAKGAAKKNVAGPGGAAEDTPAQETAPTSGAGAAKGTGSRSTTAEKGTSAKGSATTTGSTSRSSSAASSAAPDTRTIDDGTGSPEGSTVEQNPVVDVEQVDPTPTPTQEPGAAPGAGDSEPRADGASERVDDSDVDSGVTELREVTTESEAPARQESGEGETAAGSRDDAAETETAPEAATASDEAVDESTDDSPPSDGLMAVPGAEFAEIPIHEIRENPRNPRTMFHEDELDELASSVRQVGVLQPVVVRPIPVTEDGESFELVMGERRWRAARRAELESIPSIIRETSDDALLRDALLENLHRTQLNPLEEAAAYQQLLDDFGCTQDELGERIGRSRPQITNTLRLLRLPALVQRRLASGALGAGHARALLGLDDPALMEELAQRIVSEGLSVRAVERLVAGGGQPSTSRTPRRSTYDPHVVDLTSRLSNRLETQVRIDVGKRKGRVTLEFTNLDDLERLMENIGLDLPSEQEQDSRD